MRDNGDWLSDYLILAISPMIIRSSGIAPRHIPTMPLALLIEGFRFDIETETIPKMRAVKPEINERKMRIPPN